MSMLKFTGFYTAKDEEKTKKRKPRTPRTVPWQAEDEFFCCLKTD